MKQQQVFQAHKTNASEWHEWALFSFGKRVDQKSKGMGDYGPKVRETNISGPSTPRAN